MKKRILGLVCIAGVLLGPSQALADTMQPIRNLSFDQLEQEVIARNPVLLQSLDDLDSAKDLRNTGINGLQAQIDGLNGSLTALQNNVTSTSDPVTEQVIEGLIQGNIAALELQKQGLINQINTIGKSNLQIQIAEYQTVMGAEKLYIGYNSMQTTLLDLTEKRDRLNELINAFNLQVQLGMITPTDVIPSLQMSLQQAKENLKDLEFGMDTLRQNIELIKKQLNSILGQDTETPLTIQTTPELDYGALTAINFDTDYQEAVKKSYSVMLKDGDEVTLDIHNDAERSFKTGFFSVYNSVLASNDALKTAQSKLNIEQELYSKTNLKYQLGISSKLEFDMEKFNLEAAQNVLVTAQQNLFKAYRDYQWAMRGIIPSSTNSTTSNSNQ